MRKKRLCGIVCLCLVLSGGCSAAEPKEEKKSSQYFLFATPLSTHTLWQKAREGMQDACTELEVHCDWKGPIKISTDDMVDVINTGLLKKADGIITQGVISKELIQKGNDKGIPFVLVDSPVEGSSPLTTISKDFDEQARLLLADIEEKLGKNKMLRIGIQVSDLSFDLARDQIASIEAVFAQHPGGFEIVAKSESRSDQLTSRNEWIKVLQKDTGMNVSINLAGENAIGFVDASEYMDNRDTILVYGVDDMKETLELIREGKVEGSIVTSFYQYGYESVHILCSSPLTTISKDFDEQARLLLADIEEKLGKNKMLRIGIQVSDLSFDLARDQIASIEAVFAQHPGGFEIVAKSESRSDQLTSRNEWIKVLQKDTGMNVSINLAGENAIGFVDASEYMDNRDTILVYGVDDMKETLELIREGKVEGSIVTSFYQYGYESVHILYDYVTRGVRPEKERIPSYLVLVNRKNLNTYASALQKEKMHVE